MSFVVTIHGNEKVFNQDLPRQLKKLSLTSLSPGIDTQGFVIKAQIARRWPRSKTLLKLQLVEDGCNERLNVFMLGTFADKCDIAEEGDILAMSNVTVENNTRSHDPASHSCHVIVDPAEASVWLLRTNKYKLHEPQPSTSAETHSPHAIILRPPGQQSSLTSVQPPSVTPLVTASSKNTKKKPSDPYIYTPLKDIQSGSVVHVFGMVKFYKPPKKSRGSDYCMMLSLVDESFDASAIAAGAKLKCLLFAREAAQLPAIRRVGDIVRMHRLKMKTYNDELQGQRSPGFSCIVFDGNVGGSLDPITPNTSYTLTDADLDRVKALRAWNDASDTLTQQPRDSSVTTLSDVSVGEYFDLTCQVVATCVMEPNVAVLLRVWDGTKVNSATYEEDTTREELATRLTYDPALTEQATGYVVDVFVFDNHFEKASHIKTGDFVTFHNLHAMRHKKLEQGSIPVYDLLPTIEFCLHHGNSYGRGLTVLPPDDHDVNTLKTRLATIAPPSGNGMDVDGDETILPMEMGATDTQEQNCLAMVCDENINSCKGEMSVNSQPSMQVQATASQGSNLLDDARCMLRTATVITGHHHVKPTTLTDMARHTTPYKFRVRGHMIAFHPEVSTPEEFLQLFCPTCHFLSAIPRENLEQSVSAKERGQASGLTDVVAGAVREGVQYYMCPLCLKAPKDHGPCTGPRGVPELEYVYMLRFVLQDETGWLPLILWGEEAVKFFHQLEPTDLLVQPTEYTRIKTRLVDMCRDGIENSAAKRPNAECCIQTYKTPRGVTYEIFDTTICWDE